MHLTLLVPGLLWPREILHDTTFDLPLPALSQLLGRGRRSPLASADAWLADGLGIAAPLPAAALRLLADGGDPAGDEWLCLDPVHLRLQDWAVVPDHPAALGLSREEDAALRDAVAPLFSHLGEIVAHVPGRWHLRLAQAADIETLPLFDALGRAVEPTLPGGPRGAEWRRLLAEAQPLLHAHPVNRARVKAGRTIINHLWPWGGGRLPQGTQHPFDLIWSDDPVLKGLGALAGIQVTTPPARFVKAEGRVLAKLDHLVASQASCDAMAWRDVLAALEADWIKPVLTAAKRGVPRRLTFIGTGNNRALHVTASRADLWRFWRKPANLAELES
jgi:hypothetical protein